MRAFLVLTVAACLAAPTLHAQSDDTFGVWRRTCDDGPCQVYLGLRNPETDETVASIAVVRDPEADRGSMFLELPILVALQPGVTLEVGDQTEAIPYQFCRPEGCMAIAVLTPTLIGALQNADTAALSFVRYGSGTAERISVPVNGFAAAYDSLR